MQLETIWFKMRPPAGGTPPPLHKGAFLLWVEKATLAKKEHARRESLTAMLVRSNALTIGRRKLSVLFVSSPSSDLNQTE
jgi:hypothetical protein